MSADDKMIPGPVAELSGAEEDSGWDDGEDECEGHESLAGEHMGEAVYCDGSCRRVARRTRERATRERDHHGAATRSAYLCESGQQACPRHAAGGDVATSPAPAPAYRSHGGQLALSVQLATPADDCRTGLLF